jgi:hypothetical protein
MLGELPQFYMFPCSHGNNFFSMKWERSEEIKRELVVYIRGGSHTCAFS